jgi:hypothetical protein
MKKWAHELNREFSKEEVQMASKYMKNCSTSLVANQLSQPVILVTQELEISRITAQSQCGQIVHETYLKKNYHKKRAGGVAHIQEQ